MQASFRLGRIAGIEIGIHYTWFLAFILVAWSLAVGLFPAYFPGWSQGTYWLAGIIAALLLFASVLVHELAHSFVALGLGMPVHSITLFIFGGVSNLRQEAERAWDEFSISIVGPLTSIVLSGVFWGLVQVVAPSAPATAPLFFVLGRGYAPGGGVLGALLAYLAFINLLLAFFNLLPGFPLDGGRVLRSIIWGSTGSLVRATNIAAGVGQAFGWALIGWGVFQVLGGNFLGGLWTAFIGWFLQGAADASRKDTAAREIFRGVRVVQLMEPDPEAVDPDATVEEMVWDWFLRRGRRAMPVCQDGRLVGIVTLTDVKEVPSERWPDIRVREVMTTTPLYAVSPADDLAQAMGLMNEHGINQVLVMEGERLLGILNRAHILGYVHGVQELGVSPGPRRARRSRFW